jgi:outer membrane protein OmpA-like peptidoglycan-associated protein
VSLDSKVIFFDRKLHPDNSGGINDLDDIWYSVKDKEDIWSTPKQPKNNLNTKNSDVLFSITPYGKALIYGTNLGKKDEFSLADLSNETLSNSSKITIKNYTNNSSNFFGNLSGDGKILILAIEQEKGFGNLDLYVCYREESENVFTEPKNIGQTINTKQAEGSPFLAYDNKTLFFISQGHPGYGGKDIYVSRRLDDSWTNWSKPINLGKSINTPRDESSICLTALGDSAVITSWDNVNSREGIYWVCLPDSLQPSPYNVVRGKLGNYIVNQNSKSAETKFIINYDKKPQEVYYFSDKSFAFVIDSGEFVSVIVSKEGFEDFGFSLNTNRLTYSKFVDYNVTLKEQVAKEILIGKSYFDYDSYLLSDSSSKSIKDVQNYIMFPKEAKLLLIGYSDKSGTDEYNLELSRKRAESVMNELLKMGFLSNNIKIIAKGKTELMYDNDAENRRVDIFLNEH